jgi:hypothetical protein
MHRLWKISVDIGLRQSRPEFAAMLTGVDKKSGMTVPKSGVFS